MVYNISSQVNLHKEEIISIAFTKEFLATSESQMLLGKDGNRTELTIFNTSDEEFVFIGLGNETSIFTDKNTLPLAPGEAYDASVPPLNAVFIMTNGPDVPTVVYWASRSPGYVRGKLTDG